MRALIVYGLLSIMLGNVLTSIAAAENIEPTVPTVQAAKDITLESNDRQQFSFPKEVAELSTTIKNLIEDVPQSAQGDIIPFSEITGYTLSKLKLLMEFAHPIQNEPFAMRFKKIIDKATTLLANEPLEQWANLLVATEHLDIEILKAPLANGMIRYIYAHAKDRTVTANIIIGLPISDEFKGLLAKYWYLNYGTNENYILPDLDYGFSIEELATFNKLPQIETRTGAKILDLRILRIDDLTGLNSIPHIESITSLRIDLNKLSALPEKIFDKLNNLEFLSVTRNQLTTLPKEIFASLKKLTRLDLSNNHLSILPQGIFDPLNNLEFLDLRYNQLITLPKEIFASPKNLCWLYLSNNQLTILNQGTFDTLNMLDILDLDHNQLATLHRGLFASLKQLRALNLSYNQLTILDQGIFENLDSMQWFDLSHNQLTTLPRGLFASFENLEALNLMNNNLDPAQKKELQAQFGHIYRFEI